MEVATSPTEAPKKPAKLPKSKELHTSDLKIGQRDDLVLPPLGEPCEPESHVVVADAEALQREYAAALAFAEEPVTIRIEPSREKYATPFVEAWCNGKGIEILLGNRWIETKGVPVGHAVTIKRKYVEVLARSFVDNIQTEVIEPQSKDDDYVNKVKRTTSATHTFSILYDPNPRGREWLTRLLGFAN